MIKINSKKYKNTKFDQVKQNTNFGFFIEFFRDYKNSKKFINNRKKYEFGNSRVVSHNSFLKTDFKVFRPGRMYRRELAKTANRRGPKHYN